MQLEYICDAKREINGKIFTTKREKKRKFASSDIVVLKMKKIYRKVKEKENTRKKIYTNYILIFVV